MKIIKNLPKIIFLIILVLLILHLFRVNFIVVDNTTIFLIILLILAPISNSLKKIKFGDLEVEITQKEVEKIETKIENLPKEEVPPTHEINKTTDNIYSLIETDHILALAKLRIELEKILFKILLVKENNLNNKLSLSSALRHIDKNNLINKSYISPIRDVIAICNRAVHGEEIKKETAERIVDLGINLLKKLYKDLHGLISKPTTSKVILPEEIDGYINSKYQVITVVPLLNEPYINNYIFSQEQLDQFLENYNEFAEFLIEIKKVES